MSSDLGIKILTFLCSLPSGLGGGLFAQHSIGYGLGNFSLCTILIKNLKYLLSSPPQKNRNYSNIFIAHEHKLLRQIIQLQFRCKLFFFPLKSRQTKLTLIKCSTVNFFPRLLPSRNILRSKVSSLSFSWTAFQICFASHLSGWMKSADRFLSLRRNKLIRFITAPRVDEDFFFVQRKVSRRNVNRNFLLSPGEAHWNSVNLLASRNETILNAPAMALIVFDDFSLLPRCSRRIFPGHANISHFKHTSMKPHLKV